MEALGRNKADARDLKQLLSGPASGSNGKKAATVDDQHCVDTKSDNDFSDSGSEPDAIIQISLLRESLQNLISPACSRGHIPSSEPKTTSWIWDDVVFKEWNNHHSSVDSSSCADAQDASRRLLCLFGGPGTGKSVLTASIAEELSLGYGFPACFFSFNRIDESQRTLAHMLSTILWQLLEETDRRRQSCPSLRLNTSNRSPDWTVPWKAALRILQREAADSSAAAATTDSTYGLVQAIDQVLALLVAYPTQSPLPDPRIYIIIDGIDESSSSWKTDGDTNYSNCLSSVVNLLKSHPLLRVLLASREDDLWRSAMCQMEISGSDSATTTTPIPHIEMTPERLRPSLMTLLDIYFPASTGRETVRRAILQRMDEAPDITTHLWLDLATKPLLRQPLISLQEESPPHIPADVGEAYRNLFADLVDRLGGQPGNPSEGMRRAHGLLAIVIHAARPLSVAELRHAYAAKARGREEHRFLSTASSLSNFLLSDKEMLDACGDFIRFSAIQSHGGDKDDVAQARVYLRHLTVAQFVTRPRAQWPGADDHILFFWQDATDGQATMAATCLTYLSMVDYGYPLTDGDDGDDDDAGSNKIGKPSLAERYPFLEYSATGFAQHAATWSTKWESKSGLSSRTVSKTFDTELAPRVRAFVASPQAPGWLEYTMQRLFEDVGRPEVMGTVASLQAVVEKAFIENPEAIPKRLQKEQTRRDVAFGPSSARALSWKYIIVWAGDVLEEDNKVKDGNWENREDDTPITTSLPLPHMPGKPQVVSSFDPSALPMRPKEKEARHKMRLHGQNTSTATCSSGLRMSQQTSTVRLKSATGTVGSVVGKGQRDKFVRDLGPLVGSLASNRAFRAIASPSRTLQHLKMSSNALFRYSVNFLAQQRTAIWKQSLQALAQSMPPLGLIGVAWGYYHMRGHFEEAFVLYELAIRKLESATAKKASAATGDNTNSNTNTNLYLAAALYGQSLCTDYELTELKEARMRRALDLALGLSRSPQVELLIWYQRAWLADILLYRRTLNLLDLGEDDDGDAYGYAAYNLFCLGGGYQPAESVDEDEHEKSSGHADEHAGNQSAKQEGEEEYDYCEVTGSEGEEEGQTTNKANKASENGKENKGNRGNEESKVRGVHADVSDDNDAYGDEYSKEYNDYGASADPNAKESECLLAEALGLLRQVEADVDAFHGVDQSGSSGSSEHKTSSRSPLFTTSTLFKRFLLKTGLWRQQISILWINMGFRYWNAQEYEEAARMYRRNIQHCGERPGERQTAQFLDTSERCLAGLTKLGYIKPQAGDKVYA